MRLGTLELLSDISFYQVCTEDTTVRTVCRDSTRLLSPPGGGVVCHNLTDDGSPTLSG